MQDSGIQVLFREIISGGILQGLGAHDGISSFCPLIHDFSLQWSWESSVSPIQSYSFFNTLISNLSVHASAGSSLFISFTFPEILISIGF